MAKNELKKVSGKVRREIKRRGRTLKRDAKRLQKHTAKSYGSMDGSQKLAAGAGVLALIFLSVLAGRRSVRTPD